MSERGAFCEVHGDSIPNRVLEYAMENAAIDFSVGELAAEVAISRPKAYEVVADFLARGYLRKTRSIAATQLYTLDSAHPRVKHFLATFEACLELVAREVR